jgi:hypothetical protein
MIVYNNQNIENLHERMLYALLVCEYIYNKNSIELEVTWTMGGKHSVTSLHYKRRAFDFLPPKENKDKIIREIKLFLGKDFDIIDEINHIHIEYDPK